jgi:TfoX/Sxy family transcriptional regulator of competence genes
VGEHVRGLPVPPGSDPPSAYALVVAYDDDLANRIRAVLGPEPGLTEKRMFGGLAFLVGGNMAVVASHHGGVMLRIDPDESERLVATGPATLVEMRGRKMKGWIYLEPEDVRTQRQLGRWVKLGAASARALPVKR